MNDTVNPDKLKKAKIASSCFMGLGQILYLKQYVRGALFALVEVVMLCCIIFGAKKIIPANKAEDNYMKGLPSTDEMIVYLEDAEYPKLDKILDSRAKKMESFFKKYAPDYVEGMDFSDIFATEDVIFSVEDDIHNSIENEVEAEKTANNVLNKYYKIVNTFDKKLASICASDAAKNYTEQVKEGKKAAKQNDVPFVLDDYQNEFDSNYDGCDLCRKAARNGKRTIEHRAWFNGPIVSSLVGLITLGSKQPTNVAKYMDHSVFMMINGIFALVVIAFFVVLYIANIRTATKDSAKIIKNGRFPTYKETRDDLSQNAFATIGIAPSVVMIAVFSLIPLLFSALVAFTNYSSPDHIPPNNLVDWVGLENFVTMFSKNAAMGGGIWFQTFANTAIWTIVWAVFSTFTCFFVGFFFAIILQDKRVAIPSFYRTIYILPYAIPTMLSLFIWANLLNGQMGPINHTLRLLGVIDAQGATPRIFSYLSDPWVAKGALIFVNIWIGFPYSMILTTSSMTAISNSLYEAAVIDGANKWHQFKSITFPLVMFQLKPTLIMQFAGNINNFGAVFFLTGGGPNMPQPGLTTTTSCGATDLLVSWIYKLTMNTPSRYNLASVLSLLVFVVLVPFALYNFTRTKSFKDGEL
ncbi:MAG: sugar ABC transporter permease [Treponema sp.]|nr:sugar ABC transporter permease [Treponema sp.]